MIPPAPQKGRGTAHNPHNRFASSHSVVEDDGWYQEVPQTQGTEVRAETAKSMISRNTSPDLPSTAPSTLTVAASTVASTAMPVLPTPTGTFPPVWTSRPS